MSDCQWSHGLSSTCKVDCYTATSRDASVGAASNCPPVDLSEF